MQKKPYALIWFILLAFFVFHGVLENTLPIVNFFDEFIGLCCIPLAVYDLYRKHKEGTESTSGSRRWEFVLLLLFIVTGLLGNVIYRYQPLWIVAVSAVLSAKFFMILLTAGYLQRYMPVDFQELELSVEIISIVWAVYYGLTFIFPDFLTILEGWDICAKSSLLFALLIFCRHRRAWLYRVCLLLMVAMLVMCGKEKAYGAILVFTVLYYLIVYKKVQTKLHYILYMAVPVVLLAWDKIYYYYIEGHGYYAKSIMASTSMQIAKEYFPIGTGFGTFGSTYAAKWYSPVYHLYGIAADHQMGEQSRMYLTDVFWPLLLGENGILGTLLYCGLILVLFIRIQRVFYYNKTKYFLLVFMLVFMMMTTFSEAGFMQPMVMIYAFVMGALIEEYEGKREQKMKYFRQREK